MNLKLFRITNLLMLIGAFALLSALPAHSQSVAIQPQPVVFNSTNTPILSLPTVVTPTVTASGPFSTLEGYLVNNDLTYTGWDSNVFTLWQGAVFSSVSGVPGAASIGNDMGLEVPLHSFSSQSLISHLAVDSVTRFETVFGDVHSQQLGVAYNYNYGQIQLSAGIGARYGFTSGDGLHAVPWVEFKKASTGVPGVCPGVRYSYPIESKAGAGEIDLMLTFSFGKKL